jgi:hypothetical protein
MKNPFWCPTLSVNKCLTVPLLLFCVQSFAQENTIRYIYSIDEKIPLAYLRVLPINGKEAFFTDLKGKLELPKTQTAQSTSFNISGYGINDTLISIQEVISVDTIFLKTKEFELPEVAINSTQLSELKIGDSLADLWEVSKPMTLVGIADGEFYHCAIRVKITKKKQLYLDEIKFYVSNILAEKVDVSLRVLYPISSKRIIPGRINSISEFTELLRGTKIITVAKPGWQQVKFTESVPVPNGVVDLFIVFDLLEKEPKSRFAIANQKISKDIDLGFYITGGEIGVLTLDAIHPAVEITFLK